MDNQNTGLAQIDPKKRQYDFIDKAFKYHTPDEDQAKRMQLIREKAAEFARLVVDLTESSAEQTLALRSIENASMMAIKNIVVNETESDGQVRANTID